MRAEIKMITPELARELLRMNVGNRRLKAIKNAYVGQMLNGEWKENGEPIIVDVNGFIKDGQHRLNAVIEAKHSYLCPIIYDVDPDVMDTIDTGSNRSMSDILQLNGFIYYSDLASVIKSILSFDKGNNALNGDSGSMKSKIGYISNNMGLKYANKNKEGLLRLIKTSEKIYNSQSIKVVGRREIGLIIYILGGFNFNEFHVDFVKNITGVIIDQSSVTSWLYKKLASAKLNKVSISADWKKAAVIRAWNIYANGDVPVSHLKINVDNIEEITKI